MADIKSICRYISKCVIFRVIADILINRSPNIQNLLIIMVNSLKITDPDI